MTLPSDNVTIEQVRDLVAARGWVLRWQRGKHNTRMVAIFPSADTVNYMEKHVVPKKTLVATALRMLERCNRLVP